MLLDCLGAASLAVFGSVGLVMSNQKRLAIQHCSYRELSRLQSQRDRYTMLFLIALFLCVVVPPFLLGFVAALILVSLYCKLA